METLAAPVGLCVAAEYATTLKASGVGCFFFGVDGGGFDMWHLGQKKNPARTAVMKRQTRTTMAVMALGPTGLGRRGIVGLPVVGGAQYFIFLNGSRTETLLILRIPLSSTEQLRPAAPPPPPPPIRQKFSFDSLMNRNVSDPPVVQFAHFTTRIPVAVQVKPNDTLELVYMRLRMTLQLSVLTMETHGSFRDTMGGHFIESFQKCSAESDVSFDV